MKKTISLLLAVMMLLSAFGGMTISAYAVPTKGWHEETKDGITYRYYYKNGSKVTGWQTIDGKTYYFDEDFGYLCENGFFFDDVDMYYADANGLIVKNKWEKFQWKDENGQNTEWYYMGKDGKAVTGWQKISGKWYYFSPDMFVMYAGTPAEINGKWYYFKADGAMATGWQKIEGNWFYFTASGAIAKGWTKVSGKWYYFATKSDGDVESMAIGWKKISGKWYYFNTSGDMVTGWKKVGGKWYYFNGSGAMRTGWLKSGGVWYYFNTSGAMLANTSQKIGGKTYKFNASGACTNP